jgi:predicted RNA-binding Zn ribbon-like protein
LQEEEKVQSSNQIHEHPTHIATLSLLGGRLCLDFANTVDPRVGNSPHDFLTGCPDLVQWGQYVGILTEDEAQNLLREAARHPTEATATFERAIALRETIYRVFSAIASSTIPQPADLEVLQSTFAEAMTQARIMPTTNGFAWDWIKREGALDQMLWPVVRSAVELLTSEEVKRVKQCPGLGDCGWLFLDTSKNGSRQWCSMEECGSRAKMRRQYARKRASIARGRADG